MTHCMLTNITQCEISEKSEKFVVTLYNPLGQSVNQYARLPVKEDLTKSYKIYDPEGTVNTVK